MILLIGKVFALILVVNNENKIIRFEVKFSHNGNIYYRGVYKSRKAARKARERYDLVYGAYLVANVIEVYQDGTTKKGWI